MTTDVLAAARRAPSVHNTQPWELTATDGLLELRAERSRQLPVLDPTGRQLALSCGAALDHAFVAADAIAHDVRCVLLPDPADPELLGRVTWVGGGGSGSVVAEAIGRRRTYRDRFTPEPVSDGFIEELRQVASGFGCWLAHVHHPVDVLAVEVLLFRADVQQHRDSAYLEELRTWADAAPGSGHGIPVANRDPSGGAGSTLALRDFGVVPREAADPPVPDNPAVLVLGTDTDDLEAWLRCGQALSRVLLTAAASGLAAQPLGQLTDGLGWRERLAAELFLKGHVQLVLRLGHPARELPATPRRD